MKNSIVTVNCQSYSASEPSARMKPSGLTQFQFKVDMYDWMYDEDNIKCIASELIAKMTNSVERFEPTSFEFQTNPPLTLEGFDEAYKGDGVKVEPGTEGIMLTDEDELDAYYDQFSNSDREQEDSEAWAGTF